MTDERKVVWVLGAGFSAGLGGPLLQRLLSPSSENDIKVRYPDPGLFPTIHSPVATYVRSLYQHGLNHEYVVNGRTWPGELMWGHAEEFIDYLDTAAEQRAEGIPNPHAERIKAIVQGRWRSTNVSIDDLRATARHLIAAECCAFLEGVDPTREQWKPFRKWARSLTRNDTIVTFNYDRVLELLREAQNADVSRVSGARGSSLYIVTPAQTADPADWKGSTPVFKLHGSVDWQKQMAGGHVTVTVRDKLFALTCAPSELAIATPGPSKAREAEGFKALWDHAKAALAIADVVVFVGFRFPETDADVREALLGAMGERRGQAYRTLKVHVVLGYPGEHTARLEALVRFACSVPPQPLADILAATGTFEVKTHPLFAQDFFSVAARSDL
jgi:hypothetical protein